MRITNQMAMIFDMTQTASPPKPQFEAGEFKKLLNRSLGGVANQKPQGKAKTQKEPSQTEDAPPPAEAQVLTPENAAAQYMAQDAEGLHDLPTEQETTQAAVGAVTQTQQTAAVEAEVPLTAQDPLLKPQITGQPDQADFTGTETSQAVQGTQDQAVQPTQSGAAGSVREEAAQAAQDQTAQAAQAAQGQAAQDQAAQAAQAAQNGSENTQQAPVGDGQILPDDGTVETAEAPQNQNTTEVTQQPATEQDRFSSMLERAQDELNQYGTTQRAEAGERREAPVPQEPVSSEPQPERPPRQPLSELNRVAAVQSRREPAQTERQQQQQAERQVAESAAPTAPREPIVATPMEQRANPVHQQTQAQQVEARVIENLQDRRMEFEMQLYPKELGRVDVKMSLEEGRLVVQLLAQSPRAEEILRTQAQGLIASLRTSSSDLTTVQVVTGTQATQSHMYGGLDTNQSGAGGNAQTQQNGNNTGERGQHRHEEPEYRQADYRQEAVEPRRLLNYTV